MPKQQLKLMDMLTPAKTVQDRGDTLLLYHPEELRIRIQDDAVFIFVAVLMLLIPGNADCMDLQLMEEPVSGDFTTFSYESSDAGNIFHCHILL